MWARSTANMDEETSLMRVLFGSIEAAEDEDSNVIRVENHWMNPYLVHPDSSKRHRWDLIAILLVIYTTFLLPARTAFLWEVRPTQQGGNIRYTGWFPRAVTLHRPLPHPWMLEGGAESGISASRGWLVSGCAPRSSADRHAEQRTRGG